MSQCRIQSRELLRKISSTFSRRSTPLNPAGSGWVSRYVSPSSMPTGGGHGHTRMCLAVPRLSSPCLPTPTSPRDWIALARTQLGFGESASTVLSLCKRFSIRRPASKRPSSFSHSRTKFASFYRIQHGKPWPLGMVAACNRMALSGAETMRACLICCSWPSIPRLRAI